MLFQYNYYIRNQIYYHMTDIDYLWPPNQNHNDKYHLLTQN